MSELRLTERDIEITIHPTNEGPMALLGKQPVLAVGSLQATYDGDQRASATIDARSLRVVSADLSESDRAKVMDAVSKKILDVGRYPSIVFECTKISKGDDDRIEVRGTLRLHGKAREISLSFVRLGKDAPLRAETILKQSDFGITPVTAFLGALRSKDEVRIRIQARLPRA